jgi:hypothetical protein
MIDMKQNVSSTITQDTSLNLQSAFASQDLIFTTISLRGHIFDLLILTKKQKTKKKKFRRETT